MRIEPPQNFGRSTLLFPSDGRLDPSTDLFDVATLLVQMLTGELVIRHMADNLGVNRLLLPVPPFFRGAVAGWLRTEDAPATWIQDCLVAMQGWLPRSMKEYEDFEVQPFDLREGFARASGMHIPLRDRDGRDLAGHLRA